MNAKAPIRIGSAGAASMKSSPNSSRTSGSEATSVNPSAGSETIPR